MKLNKLTDWSDLFDQSFCDELPYELVRPGGVMGPAQLAEMSAEANNLLRSSWAKRATVQDVDTLWFVSNALKKFSAGGTIPKDIADSAVSDWVKRNKSVKQDLPWWIQCRARQLLARALPEPNDEYESIMGRFGPGAVREGYNLLARWNRSVGFPYSVRSPEQALSLLGDDGARGGSNRRVASLCAVPKDAWRARTITVESASMSFAQQWAREVLRTSVHIGPLRGSVMDTLGVRERHFEIQAERAVQASRSGRLATVDLKDASDTISWAQVWAVFPAWVCRTLHSCRSDLVEWRTPRGERLQDEIRMYAGMGNATTYVVETLYFWAIITAIAEKLRDSTPVYVVGDDIICGTGTASHPMFRDYLVDCGITVNEGKTFARGTTFRESCGVAAFNGLRLSTLNRIAGYDTEQNADIIRACGLVTRLRSSPCWAQQLIGESLSAVGFIRGNTHHGLAQECDLTSIPSEGDWGDVRYEANLAEQRWMVKARCLTGATETVHLWSINEVELLAVLRGAITDGRDGAHADTILRLPIRGQTQVVRRKISLDWSPTKAPAGQENP